MKVWNEGAMEAIEDKGILQDNWQDKEQWPLGINC